MTGYVVAFGAGLVVGALLTLGYAALVGASIASRIEEEEERRSRFEALS